MKTANFLPAIVFLSVGMASPGKGLAMAVHNLADADALNVSWYHEWNYCDENDDARCVDMSYEMTVPPDCPEVLLVGNEPNAIVPYGFPLEPQEAARRVLAIEAACPDAKLVVGNVSAENWQMGLGSGKDWLKQFLVAYHNLSGRDYSQALGIHCFTQRRAGWCIRQLKGMRSVYQGEMWVTEWNVISGDAQQFRKLLDYIASHFTGWSAYTNRQPYPCGWCLPRGAELVNPDGSLSPSGVIYAGG